MIGTIGPVNTTFRAFLHTNPFEFSRDEWAIVNFTFPAAGNPFFHERIVLICMLYGMVDTLSQNDTS